MLGRSFLCHLLSLGSPSKPAPSNGQEPTCLSPTWRCPSPAPPGPTCWPALRGTSGFAGLESNCEESILVSFTAKKGDLARGWRLGAARSARQAQTLHTCKSFRCSPLGSGLLALPGGMFQQQGRVLPAPRFSHPPSLSPHPCTDSALLPGRQLATCWRPGSGYGRVQGPTTCSLTASPVHRAVSSA